jgi:hypothetical protein
MSREKELVGLLVIVRKEEKEDLHEKRGRTDEDC